MSRDSPPGGASFVPLRHTTFEPETAETRKMLGNPSQSVRVFIF
jgi:hypothetical protein